MIIFLSDVNCVRRGWRFSQRMLHICFKTLWIHRKQTRLRIGEQFTIIMPLLSTTKQFHEPHRCRSFDLFKWMIAQFRSGKFKLLLIQRSKIFTFIQNCTFKSNAIKLWQCVWIDKYILNDWKNIHTQRHKRFLKKFLFIQIQI